MAEPIGVYFTTPPRGKPSPWVGIKGYLLYLAWGLTILAALRLVAWVDRWLI